MNPPSVRKVKSAMNLYLRDSAAVGEAHVGRVILARARSNWPQHGLPNNSGKDKSTPTQVERLCQGPFVGGHKLGRLAVMHPCRRRTLGVHFLKTSFFYHTVVMEV